MIITLFFVALIISGIAVFAYEEYRYGYGYNLYTFCASFIGSICLLTCIILILLAHVGVDNQIEVAKIHRAGIEQRYDAINSQCEDISKVTVLQEVEEWNRKVTVDRYWCNHPMTSWFFSKEYVNSLELIDTTK